MTTLARPGMPVGGFKTVGQIRATNDLVFRRNQNAMGVAVELLMTHTPGAPVVDERGEFIGFVSEFDLLRAFDAKKDLNQLTAGDVMAKRPYCGDDRNQRRRGGEAHGGEAASQSADLSEWESGLFHHAA